MRDNLIFGGVVAIRLLVPLLILRYPLPGIGAAILADCDRGPLHAFTSVSLDDYQMYDKSFDVYYLSVAYLSTLRNWPNPTAVTIGRFLWLYRLVGVALFALVGDHRLLFLFPAAFEFYFVLYEVIRLRWTPQRFGGTDLLLLAMTAWMLKLPQEYWLHVARRGTTAWLEDHVFGADLSIRHLPLMPVVLAAAAAVPTLWRVASRRLPAPHHATCFDANAQDTTAQHLLGQPRSAKPVLSPALAEKLGLVTLLGMLVTEFAPGVDANTVQIAIALVFVVVGNAMLNVWFAGHGSSGRSALGDFSIACALNAPILLSLTIAARWLNASMPIWIAVALMMLASLLTGLHDRYHHVYQCRLTLVDNLEP
jgi:hypothetical protein